MRNALISVYNKDGIEFFAKSLVDLGWRIISSGGTAKVIAAAGIPVTDVAEITGMPAVLGHRVVTLAPQIHGGLLATEAMRDELEKLGWPWIDLLCVDFYPLSEAAVKIGATRESITEMTDIGGPAMLRSAAKGRRIAISSVGQRRDVLEWLRAGEPESKLFRESLALSAELAATGYSLESVKQICAFLNIKAPFA